MARDLTASFILRLEDRLSGGLTKLTRLFERLNSIGRGLGLGGLAGGEAPLGRLAVLTGRLIGRLDDLTAAALRARGALGGLGGVQIGGSVSPMLLTGPGSIGGQIARATALALPLALAGTMGSGPVPGPSLLPRLSAPYAMPAPMLRLAGPSVPAGGGIPLARPDMSLLRTTALQSSLGLLATRAGEAAAKIGIMGGAVAGAAIVAPIQQAVSFDQRLRDTALTAGATGPAVEEMIAKLRQQYETVSLATGQSALGIAQASASLIGAGMDRALSDTLLPIIGRVATASSASVEDIAKSAFALSTALKTPAQDMERALAIMLAGGKMGAFELKEMAAAFPLLANQVGSIQGQATIEGLQGLVASLQIARMGTGTSGQAATNYSEFTTKIFSQDAVKNFKDVGISVEGVFNDAIKKGISPIEAIVQKIREITKGGDPFALGGLFADQQAVQFLRPMMANTDKYLEMKAELGNVTPASIMRDFEAQMRGPQAKLNELQNRTTMLTRRFGLEIMGGSSMALGLVAQLNDAVAWLDANAPGSVGIISNIGGSVLGLVAVLGVLGPVAGRGFGILSAVLLRVLTFFRPLLPLLTGLARVALLVAGAFGGPFVAAALAVAGVAFLVWRNWDGVRRVLGEAWAGIAIVARQAWQDLQGVFGHFVAWVDSWTGGALTAVLAKVGPVFNVLRALGSGVWDGLKGAFASLIDWIDAWITGPLNAAIGKIEGAFARVRAARETPEAKAQDAARNAMFGVDGVAQWPLPPAPNAAPAPAAGSASTVTIRAEPGTVVTGVQQDAGSSPVRIDPARGNTTRRP